MRHDAKGCRDVPFSATYAMDEADEAALEDYARVLAGVAEAEVLRGGPGVSGLHLCGTEPPEGDVLRDLEDFARELAASRRYGRRWA
jgi:hypothetical protein